jgi:hypothetical protein
MVRAVLHTVDRNVPVNLATAESQLRGSSASPRSGDGCARLVGCAEARLCDRR